MNVSYGSPWAWKPIDPRLAANIDRRRYTRLRRSPPPGYAGWEWDQYRPRLASQVDQAKYRRLRRAPPPGYAGPYGIEDATVAVKSWERDVAGKVIQTINPGSTWLVPGTGVLKPGFGPHKDDPEVVAPGPTNDQVTAEVVVSDPANPASQVVVQTPAEEEEEKSNLIYWVVGGVGALAVGGVLLALLIPKKER